MRIRYGSEALGRRAEDAEAKAAAVCHSAVVSRMRVLLNCVWHTSHIMWLCVALIRTGWQQLESGSQLLAQERRLHAQHSTRAHQLQKVRFRRSLNVVASVAKLPLARLPSGAISARYKSVTDRGG